MAENEIEELSLVNIKGGAAVEIFDLLLRDVILNCSDVNTSLKPREIKLVVSFRPTPERSLVSIAVKADSKLQGPDPAECIAGIKVNSHGRTIGVNRDRQQRSIPFNVARIDGGSKND